MASTLLTLASPLASLPIPQTSPTTYFPLDNSPSRTASATTYFPGDSSPSTTSSPSPSISSSPHLFNGTPSPSAIAGLSIALILASIALIILLIYVYRTLTTNDGNLAATGGRISWNSRAPMMEKVASNSTMVSTQSGSGSRNGKNGVWHGHLVTRVSEESPRAEMPAGVRMGVGEVVELP